MAQSYPQICPQCGTQVAAGQRFCPICGATMDANSNHLPMFPPASAAIPSPVQTMAPPNIYKESPIAAPPPLIAPWSQPAQSPQPLYEPTPAAASPQKKGAKRGPGRISYGIALLIVLIIVVLGGTSYAGYKWISSSLKSGASATATATGTPGSTIPPPTIPAKADINSTLTYASVDMTIVSVQEANKFADDTSTTASLIFRVNLKEHNPSSNEVFFSYENVQLVLPDGTSEIPTANQGSTGGDLKAGATQTTWLDYPLTTPETISTLLVRFGAPTEAQMNVPLTGKANLSTYQTKTINPKITFQYAGLKWTLASVTASLSLNGKQADSDMEYVVLTLKVDNPSAIEFFPFPNDNIRLQTATITNAPLDSTLSMSIPANTTGTTGTITFEMPQGSRVFSLMLLARSDTNPPAGQVITSFKL